MPKAIFRSCLPALPLVLTLSLLCLSGCAVVGPSINCVSGDCVNGQGAMVGFGGWSYAGQFQGGEAQGKGAFTWTDGTRFEGNFEGGRRVGPGVLTRTNGQVVRGVWNDVKGVGYQNIAEFSADPPQKEQPTLAGCIQGDCANGQGTFTWPAGQRYVGQFKDGKRSGQGIFTRPDGHRYVGEFKDDKANGQGTVSSPNGHSYIGELKDDKANGQGTQIWLNGNKYVGGFRDDKANGLGIFTSPGQPPKRGLWADDQFITPLSEQEYAASLSGPGPAVLADAKTTDPHRLKVQKPLAVESHAPAKNAGPTTRRVALVIGNGAYPTAPLKNPVNDARDMAAALKSLGFEVILRENASLAQMEGAVEEFWAQLRRGGAGLFYFAGHGVQVAGRNYLVPVDARLSAEQDAKYKCMDAGLVLGRMENAGNDLNLIILDACRNNPFARSWRSAEQGLAKMDAPRGSIIAYATAPDSVAADGAGRNGIYTEKLLRAMRTPGQPVELVFKHVRDEVMRATADKQVPWESTSLRGDFYFTNP